MVASSKKSAVADPVVDNDEQTDSGSKPQRQPRYHVVLWDDDDHTYEYVIHMMKQLFGHPRQKAMQIAVQVATAGRAVCLTTTKEHAELKRDQIHAFGEVLMDSSKGSMRASIEPVDAS